MNSLIRKFFGSPDISDPWPEQTELIRWNGTQPWTIADSFEGVQVFGDTGSGKSSASAVVLASAMLRAGYGGLVLTVKPEDRETWFDWARRNGREDDLVLFGPGYGTNFNFLAYQAEHGERQGLGVRPAVDLLYELVKLAGTATQANDSFWQQAARNMIAHAMEIVVAAGGQPSMQVLHEFVLNAPKSVAQARDPLWQSASPCWSIIQRARSQQPKSLDVQLAVDYWLVQHCELNSRTRTSNEITFTAGVAAKFSGTLMDQLFGCPYSPATTQSPRFRTVTSDDLSAGKIVLVDLPVKTYGNDGRFAGVVWKYCTQIAMERRANKERPVFIFSDESHFFLTENDPDFQSTARSARCCTVYLTQNLGSYYATNPGAAGQQRVLSLLANLKTRILHQSSHTDTRNWLSESVGKHRVERRTESTNFGKGQPTYSESKTLSDEYWIDPSAAALLKTGGASYGGIVTAIVAKAGKKFSDGRPWLEAKFEQGKIESSWWRNRTGVVVKL